MSLNLNWWRTTSQHRVSTNDAGLYLLSIPGELQLFGAQGLERGCISITLGDLLTKLLSLGSRVIEL